MEKFLQMVERWADQNPDIQGVVVVGSYARGTATPSSDLDLCILTEQKTEMLKDQEFPALFGKVIKKQTEYYGACTSIRVWYADGKEVEFGLVEPSWIAVPLDPGTADVLRDGYRVVVDKRGLFQNLIIQRERK